MYYQFAAVMPRVLVICFLVFGSAHGLELQNKERRLTEEIIKHNGYPADSNDIITADGYILKLIRMHNIKENSKPPILLVHGLLGSGTDWVLQKDMLGYRLHDEGFDVWILHTRGNTQSQNHTILEKNSAQFWNFSWHEIGMYDLPVTIDHVLNITGFKKLIYVGYSQGCTSMNVLLSERPEYNEKIVMYLAVSPASYLCNFTNIFVRQVMNAERDFLTITNMRQIIGDFNTNRLLQPILGIVCNRTRLNRAACYAFVSVISDFSVDEMDDGLMDTFLNLYPAGGSSKQLVHYIQNAGSCRFSKYRNALNEIPEDYKVSNIRVPVYAIFGKKDRLVRYEDNVRFGRDLPNRYARAYAFDDVAHADLCFGKSARLRAKKEIVDLLVSNFG